MIGHIERIKYENNAKSRYFIDTLYAKSVEYDYNFTNFSKADTTALTPLRVMGCRLKENWYPTLKKTEQ